MTTTRVVALAGAVLLVCGVSVSCTTSGTPVAQQTTAGESTAVAAPPTSTAAPAPPSDEDQVRQALKVLQDAYNTQNWDVYLQMLCPSERAKFTGGVMDSLKKTRADMGVTTATVVSVTVDGDNASAVVDGNSEVAGSGRVTMKFERGDDGWKLCMRY